MRLGLFLGVSLLALACSLSAHDLVEVRTINPRIQVEMRYATADNPLGRPVYPYPGCFLVREVAEKLSRVQKDLEKQCLTLVVWDAYRPYSMQPVFWRETEAGLMENGSVPSVEAEDESGHNRGTAVDVTIACSNGSPLEMPTDYEDFSERAHRYCRTLEAHIYHNRQVLEKAMARHGFVPSTTEWWHFDYRGGLCYPILDVKFEELVDCHIPPFVSCPGQADDCRQSGAAIYFW